MLIDPYIEERLTTIASLTDQCLMALEKIMQLTFIENQTSKDPPIVEDLEFVGYALNKAEVHSYERDKNNSIAPKIWEDPIC